MRALILFAALVVLSAQSEALHSQARGRLVAAAGSEGPNVMASLQASLQYHHPPSPSPSLVSQRPFAALARALRADLPPSSNAPQNSTASTTAQTNTTNTLTATILNTTASTVPPPALNPTQSVASLATPIPAASAPSSAPVPATGAPPPTQVPQNPLPQPPGPIRVSPGRVLAVIDSFATGDSDILARVVRTGEVRPRRSSASPPPGRYVQPQNLVEPVYDYSPPVMPTPSSSSSSASASTLPSLSESSQAPPTRQSSHQESSNSLTFSMSALQNLQQAPRLPSPSPDIHATPTVTRGTFPHSQVNIPLKAPTNPIVDASQPVNALFRGSIGQAPASRLPPPVTPSLPAFSVNSESSDGRKFRSKSQSSEESSEESGESSQSDAALAAKAIMARAVIEQQLTLQAIGA